MAGGGFEPPHQPIWRSGFGLRHGSKMAYFKAVARRQTISNRDFLERVKDYLPAEAGAGKSGGPGEKCPASLAWEWMGDTFHTMDVETMVAASHAIEDLALDEANGRLLVLFQDFKYFHSHQERYQHLVQTVDEVTVLGCGKTPRPAGRVRFVNVSHTALSAFWLVMYQGRRAQVLLLSRQTNTTAVLADKRFFGFHSFAARLAARVRRDLDALLAGSATTLREYDRLWAVDQALRQVRTVFAREQSRLENALLKIKTDGRPAGAHQFAAELDRALRRLQGLQDCWTEPSASTTQEPTRPARD